jgi:hypothetical protein
MVHTVTGVTGFFFASRATHQVLLWGCHFKNWWHQTAATRDCSHPAGYKQKLSELVHRLM